MLVPLVNIKIKNKPLPMEAKAISLTVTVLEDLEAPAMFTIELNSWDLVNNKANWVDSDEWFSLGNEIVIEMGYKSQTEKFIMLGEITGLEPEFTQDGATLTVRGHNYGHRLLRGRQTKTYAKKTDSDIAEEIAKDYGLTTTEASKNTTEAPKNTITDTKIKHPYVVRYNQTALEFLQDRARRIGYEVFVINKALYFRPRNHNTKEILTLNREDLSQFSPRLSSLNQVSQVEVHSRQPLDKTGEEWTKSLVTQATVSDMKAMGSNPGSTVVKNAFSKYGAVSEVINRPIFTAKEAEDLAQGQFNNLALSYITGEGSCAGNGQLRAGNVIEITNLGTRFSGKYYLTSTTHTYSTESGYTTDFSVKSNADFKKKQIINNQ